MLMKHVKVARPKPEKVWLSENWPKAKLRKRRPCSDLTDREVDEILSQPDPPDSYDDDYDGAY